MPRGRAASTGRPRASLAATASHAASAADAATAAQADATAARDGRDACMPSPPRARLPGSVSSSRVETATPRRSNRPRSSAALQPPQPEREPRRSGAVPGSTYGSGEISSDDEVVAAAAEVDQRGNRALVEERRERDDERTRRQRARRDHVDVLPRVAELDARLEQRVDEAVALHDARARLEPAQDAAERDEADAVTPLEEAGSPASPRLGRRARASPRPPRAPRRSCRGRSRRRRCARDGAR